MTSDVDVHKYGTPLPLLEFDEVVPTKKPVYAQDQIATDDQGRRRFHGAFTGGFSAGYWNTVGSKEGWTPQSFKSSRSEKASGRVTQRPEDFMDDEDLGEFGIAPKGLQIQEDYTGPETSKEQRKRKFLQSDLKAIPGEPVLQQLLRPVKDKVSVRILKSWGWRPGQGLGPRQTRKEKKKARERNKKELYLLEKYGCELPTNSKTANDTDDDDDQDDDDDDSEEDDITFAPEDFEPIPYGVKEDRYGLGYKPLSRHSVLGGSNQSSSSVAAHKEHINLFKPLEMMGKNNQKISFAGQAFGVGALEEDDDEDVYATDDLTRYDFSLEDKKKPKKSKKALTPDELIFEDFHIDLKPDKPLEYKLEIPFGWQPRNWYEKRSRFEPLDPRTQRQLEKKFAKPQDINADEGEMTRERRAELLGEEIKRKEEETKGHFVPPSVVKPSIAELQRQQKERKQKTQDLMEKISAKSSNFTRGGIITIEGEEKAAPPLTAEEISSAFKPFANDNAKQKRYEQFLAANLQSDQEIDDFLKNIQPIELSLWDRQMEKKEFVQAKKLYRPLKGIMSDRFVTESQVKAEQKVAEIEKDPSKPIVVERSKMMWKPHSLLCKRYNIAEPFGGLMEDEKKKSKNKSKMSVFDYLETSVNKKEDFQTPVIIPKNVEKPQELVKQQTSDSANVTEEKEEGTVNLEWQDVLQGKTKATEEKPSFVFKPKTDLEKQVVESMDKPITEKKELFKSIFSDSESDGEEEVNSKPGQHPTDILNPLSKPLNAAAANLLRNNSPPRGIFKALFNVPVNNTTESTKSEEEKTQSTNEVVEKQNDIEMVEPAKETPKQIETTKILFQPKSSREPKENSNYTFTSSLPSANTTELYGPSLPSNLKANDNTKTAASSSTSAAVVDAKLLELFNKHKTSARLTEVWVEKSSQRDSSDSDDDSSSSETSSSSDDDDVKHKKRSKKSKKKKSSEHKHKKHKEHKEHHKSSKKSKKSDKKKKKKHKKK